MPGNLCGRTQWLPSSSRAKVNPCKIWQDDATDLLITKLDAMQELVIVR